MFYRHCRSASAAKLICNPKWPWVSDSSASPSKYWYYKCILQFVHVGLRKRTQSIHINTHAQKHSVCLWMHVWVLGWLWVSSSITVPHIYWSGVFQLNSELTDLPSLVSSLALWLYLQCPGIVGRLLLPRGCWIKGLLADCHTHVDTGSLNSGPQDWSASTLPMETSL